MKFYIAGSFQTIFDRLYTDAEYFISWKWV